MSYRLGQKNTVQYSVIGVDGRARRTVDIEGLGKSDDARLLAHRAVCGVLRPASRFDVEQAVEMTVPKALRLRPVDDVGSSRVGCASRPGGRAHAGRAERDRRFPYSWNPRYPHGSA